MEYSKEKHIITERKHKSMAITDILNLNNKAKIPTQMPLVKNPFVKALEEKVKEKSQIYNYIGVEVFELYNAGEVKIPQLDVYFEKLKALNEEINIIEAERQKLELQQKGSTQCSCGCMLTIKDKFCPSCGKPVDNGLIVCICGNQVSDNVQFCPNCGTNIPNLKQMRQNGQMAGGTMQQMPSPQSTNGQVGMPVAAVNVPTKECICGAKVPEGQTMCMECGRKI